MSMTLKAIIAERNLLERTIFELGHRRHVRTEVG